MSKVSYVEGAEERIQGKFRMFRASLARDFLNYSSKAVEAVLDGCRTK